MNYNISLCFSEKTLVAIFGFLVLTAPLYPITREYEPEYEYRCTNKAGNHLCREKGKEFDDVKVIYEKGNEVLVDSVVIVPEAGARFGDKGNRIEENKHIKIKVSSSYFYVIFSEIEWIEKIGDPFLGKGKTQKIMEIAEKEARGELTEREATRKIIDEVPTGLPEPIDNFIKNFSLGNE